MKKIFIILYIFLNFYYIYSQDQTTDLIKKEKENVNINVNTNTESNTKVNTTTDTTTDTTTNKESSTNVNTTTNTNINTNTIQPEKNKVVEPAKNGWDLYQEGRFYDSIIQLKEEIKRYPDRINIYVILGWNYKELRRYKEMEEISLAGYKMNSTDIRIIKNLGESYFFQNEYLKTIKEFEKYISFRYNSNDPFLATAYYYLGTCFFNLGSYRKADIALSSSNIFQPNNYKVLLLLGKTMIELKEYEKAKKYLNEVLRINPNNNEALEGLKRIKDF